MRRALALLHLVRQRRPGRRVPARKEPIDDTEDVQRRDVVRQPPQQENGSDSPRRGKQDAFRDVVPVSEVAGEDAAEDGHEVEEGDGEGGEEVACAEGAGVRGQKDRGDPEADGLHCVAELVDQVDFVPEEAEAELAEVRVADGDARLVECHEGGGEEEERDGAGAKGCLPAVSVEEGLEDQWEEDACEAGAALWEVSWMEVL